MNSEDMETKEIIELVGHGHPDRFADYISEKLNEFFIKKDENAKNGIEVMVTSTKIFLGGETSIIKSAKIKKEIIDLVYSCLSEVYSEKWWPNFRNEVEIIDNINSQSKELSKIQEK